MSSEKGQHAASRKNRLAGEASSYLRSAEHQPVDWHPWGTQAFEKAKREDKPILLDIGAVWCHWCHVMDGESYENEETARIINENFVAIKVDRDERPDVDARYQGAVAALTGGGGWPLTAFLTPDGRIFTGGTYFPPRDSHNLPAFPKLLRAVSEAYHKNKEKVVEQAEEIMKAVGRGSDKPVAPGELSPGMLKRAFNAAMLNFDPVHGGFGEAPKFPHASAVELLLGEIAATGDDALKSVVDVTLTKMAQGGVHDQIGGGFHRYSTDAGWTVPHFEKMLYDNSELLRNFAQAYAVMKDPYFAEVARGIVSYVDRALSDRDRGGFFASQDADAGPGDDGDYWTWTAKELEEAVGTGELYQILAAHFDVLARGEMRHNHAKNVLWVAASPEELAVKFKRGESQLRALIAQGKRRMLESRGQRPAPFVDRTVYVSWNGLMLSAYIEAWKALDVPSCRDFAVKTADLLLETCFDLARGMAHQWRPETGPRVWGLLDDQAMFGLALLDVFDVTQDPKYLDAARSLASLVLDKFQDSDGALRDAAPGLADTSTSEALKVPVRPFQDAPTPAGNPIAAILLDRLEAVTGKAKYREGAERILKSFAQASRQYGIFAATYFGAVRLHLERPVHVTVVGDRSDARTRALLEAAVRSYPPHKAVVSLSPDESPPPGFPESVRDFAEGYPREKLPAACVCRGTHCNLPTSDPADLARQVWPDAIGTG